MGMRYLQRIVGTAVIFAVANLPALLHLGMPGWAAALAVPLFLIVMVTPSAANRRLPARRLRICGDGCELLGLFLVFLYATPVSNFIMNYETMMFQQMQKLLEAM